MENGSQNTARRPGLAVISGSDLNVHRQFGFSSYSEKRNECNRGGMAIKRTGNNSKPYNAGIMFGVGSTTEQTHSPFLRLQIVGFLGLASLTI